MATTPQRPADRPVDQGTGQRESPKSAAGQTATRTRGDRIDHTRAEPLERAEGSSLRRTPEQAPEAAAPRITTDAEPIRPTPDDALHGAPPDLTHGTHPHREADEPLHWGALAAIAVVIGLFLFAIASLIAQG